jgi:hypothetical protein
LKKPTQKRAGVMVQGVGPKFKSHTAQKERTIKGKDPT